MKSTQFINSLKNDKERKVEAEEHRSLPKTIIFKRQILSRCDRSIICFSYIGLVVFRSYCVDSNLTRRCGRKAICGMEG